MFIIAETKPNYFNIVLRICYFSKIRLLPFHVIITALIIITEFTLPPLQYIFSEFRI